MTEQIFFSPWFHGALGLSVGMGLMILFLAKWGRRIFALNNTAGATDSSVVHRLWAKINDIEGRQVELRTHLPRDYVEKHEFSTLHEGQARIEYKLDEFMADCRRGDCAAGRQFREVKGSI